jgi:hypothetical protein
VLTDAGGNSVEYRKGVVVERRHPEHILAQGSAPILGDC